MNQQSCVDCVLIESPGWLDASFYGKWLLAAFEAQKLWSEAVQSDCEFRSQIDHLEVLGSVLLGTEAFKVVGKIAENVRTLIVRVDSDLGDSVALLARMGFFALTGARYQMILPTRLDAKIVKDAALALAATEDDEFAIHPEHLLKIMPLSSAQRWHDRLQQMYEGQRLADRNALLCYD
jgi:hypothetical protein